MPSDILQAIKPIYEDLSKDELLQRCVEGLTQNNNESFNQNVWKVIPKNLPAIFKTVSIGAYIATCVLKAGTYSLLALSNGLGISCVPNAHNYVTQEQRKMLRRQQKIASAEAANESEGSLYSLGINDLM